MKIVHAASEAAPFVKTGGLGDVMQALPAALSRYRDCEVSLFLPLYGTIKQDPSIHLQKITDFTVFLGWREQYVGLFQLKSRAKKKVYFIDNEFYFCRNRIYGEGDDAERFAFYSKAVLACIAFLGLDPDIIQCNDWQTACIPVFLHAEFAQQFPHAKCVFTIHNIEYQGWADRDFFSNVLALPEQYRDDLTMGDSINLMKGAIMTADRVTTVSETYAQELHYSYFAHGMETCLGYRGADFSGILNGIDTTVFNPAQDKLLAQPYGADTMREGKAACKAALQREVGLAVRPDAPVLAMVTRLAGHKGIDLLCYILDRLMERDVQFVLVGSGEARFEDALRAAVKRYPGRLAAILRYDGQLANRIYAGADLYLMPSQAEPCGLSQLIAMHYGTVPVVHATGGLRDTVLPYDPATGDGRGFTFQSYNGDDFLAAIDRALALFTGDRAAWDKLAQQDMREDFSWRVPAKAYRALFASLHEG